MMNVGSLSSGYGGLEMALNLVFPGQFSVAWHAEIDPDASLVLKTWWPKVPNLGDFTVPDFWEQAERVDTMLGGIPCQPFSAAGRRAGTADQRHLWPFWLDGIRIQRPGSIVLENVAGLTQGRMRPIFDGIIADLLALGYDVRWCLLGACAVGAAHHRHRVFLLARCTSGTPTAEQVKVQTCGQRSAAYLPTPQARDGLPGGDSPGGIGGVRPSGAKRAVSLSAVAKHELPPTPQARDSSTRGEGGEEYWRQRRAEGFTGGVPLGAALALLPSPRAIDAVRGPVTVERTEASGRRNGIELASALNMLPSPRATDGSNGGPSQGIASGDVTLPSAVQPERWGKYAPAVARHAAVLGRPAPEPTELGPKGGRRLAAAFSEWLMMLPEGHLTSVLARNPALARAGNGVIPLQAATAIQLLLQS